MIYQEKRHFVLERNDEFIDWLDENGINVYREEDVEKMYDTFLDDMFELSDFGLLSDGYAYILENLDPTAYRCGFNDFLDSCGYNECDYNLFDGHYFESRHYYDEDDVIDAFIEYIEELESEDNETEEE